jgi:predicted PurR-regulated permease PerM
MSKEKLELTISTEALLKVFLFIAAPIFLWSIRDILLILLISATIASGLEPLVNTLRAKKVPRGVSVISVYLIALSLVVFIGFMVIPPFINEFQDFSNNSGQLLSEFQQRVNVDSERSNFVQVQIANAISNGIHSFGEQVASFSDNFFQRTIGFFSGFVQLLTVLTIAFYLVAERNGMKHLITTFVPVGYQPRFIRVINKIQSKVGYWMFGQFILCVIIFALTWIGLTLLGVRYALVLALLAGFMELIPYIGPFISAVPGIFIAFLQDPTLALIVAVMYYVIQSAENYFLVPKIMNRAVGLSPLVVLVSLLVGLKLAGILGVLLAIPVTASIQVIIQDVWNNRNERLSEAEIVSNDENIV